MKWSVRAVGVVAIIGLAGCGIGHAITAPVRYVFHSPEPTPVPSTSDVTNPGHPMPVPSPRATPRVASRKLTQRSAASKSSPSPASAVQFPVAKPVPGKPGLVFNPFNTNGGYIDVSGYAPGSKVKDPESQNIFVVP